MGARKSDQAVDAFSAPRTLLRAAQMEAKRRRMTKSAFYRFCLAKTLGHTEAEAMEIAEHASTFSFTVIAETPAKKTKRK